MAFAIIQICSIIACFVLRNPIKKWPMLFYVLSALIVVMFFAGTYFDLGITRNIWTIFFLLVQKCTLSLALFVVVMFIGVLPHSSRLFTWLNPIRAEISIIAWILSLGHVVVYTLSYLPRMLSGSAVNLNVVASFIVAVILLILLILLGVTSFGFIKKKMKAENWKKLQKLSYPFFILVYLHVLLMLLPSAINGGIASGISVAVYSVIFIAYIVLRVARVFLDKRAAS